MAYLYKLDMKLSKCLTNHWKRLIFSLLFVSLLFMIFCFTRPIFLGIGDVNMMKNYIGYRTGNLDANHPYGHVLIGWLFTFLYGKMPKIPWFILLNIGVLVLALTLILYSFLTLAEKNKKGVLKTIGLYCFLYFFVFIFVYTEITYTVNAAIVCAAAIALLFSSLYETNVYSWIDFCFSCLLMCGAAVIRFSVFKMAIFFWTLVFLFSIICLIYQNKSKYKILIKCILALVMIVMAMQSSTFYLNYREKYETKQYVEYNEARIRFMDYEIAPYFGNENFYNSIGWNENLYKLTTFYYFMDDTFTTQNLEKVIEYSDHHKESKTLSDLITFADETLVKDSCGLLMTMTIFILLLYFVCCIKFSKEYILLSIGAGASVLGTIIFCGYLSYLGRFPLRTYQSIAFQSIVILSCLIILVQKESIKTKYLNHKFLTILTIIFSYLITANGIYYSYNLVCNQNDIQSAEQYNINSQAMGVYALAHKENVYIYDTSVSGDYRKNIDVTEGSPTNLIMWGGTNMFNRAYYNQLKAMKKKKLTSESWFDNNVYYLTTISEINERRDNLYAYLLSKNGNISMNLVDVINSSVAVYKFTKK